MKLLLVALLAAVLLPSCQKHSRQDPAVAITRTDDIGHTVSLSRAPQRIVSLAPSLTETLFALGLDSSLVGVTDYCDYPPAAKSKPKIGGIMNPNIERILALQPDLVLMSGSGNMRSDYDKLTSSGIKVFVSNPRTIEGVLKSIGDLGFLTFKSELADSMVRRLQLHKDEVVRRASASPRMTVLMLLSLNPIVAIGPGTFLDEIIGLANGENIARSATTAYPLLSREEILRRRPDIIIATNDIVHSPGDILTSYPEWKTLPAILRNHVTIVDASIVSRPGPRIVDGLEAVANAIHPGR
jgi:iron complex transport system substrate-binding protein